MKEGNITIKNAADIITHRNQLTLRQRGLSRRFENLRWRTAAILTRTHQEMRAAFKIRTRATPCMADIQSATAEIRRGIKKKKIDR